MTVYFIIVILGFIFFGFYSGWTSGDIIYCTQCRNRLDRLDRLGRSSIETCPNCGAKNYRPQK